MDEQQRIAQLRHELHEHNYRYYLWTSNNG